MVLKEQLRLSRIGYGLFTEEGQFGTPSFLYPGIF